MVESMTVTVGLDQHARSIRLAVVRVDELLEERTLPLDEEAVAQLPRRWRGLGGVAREPPGAFVRDGVENLRSGQYLVPRNHAG